jgi:hypothetical protein
MATSKLQRRTREFLSAHFWKLTIQENIRPDWLITESGERLELDFYVSELDLAIEVQGEQHFVFSSFFHKLPEDFNKRLRWDRFKKEICLERGIELVEIIDDDNLLDLLKFLPRSLTDEEFIQEARAEGALQTQRKKLARQAVNDLVKNIIE